MAILQKDIKLLWGRAASRCAICQKQLCQDKANVSSSFPFGEQAHIVAEKENGARGKSVLTLEERNSYHNLILLCPTHHTIIDRNVEDYPVEKLQYLKSKHELWVQNSLSEQTDSEQIITDTIYGHLVDKTVELCNLNDWNGWTSSAIGAAPSIGEVFRFQVMEFGQVVLAAIWPGKLLELERSIQTIAYTLTEAFNVFMLHAELNGDRFRPDYFYRAKFFPEEVYQEKLRQFKNWMSDYYSLMVETTKAFNWFADMVRRDINPMFYALKGRFFLTDISNLIDSGIESKLFQYTSDETKNLPQSFLKKRKEIEKNY